MKTIEVVMNFKDKGRDFYAGERRTVSDEDAYLFCTAGWARSSGIDTGLPSTEPVTLHVQNLVNGQVAEEPV